MNLATPERIRSLQRKLYCKAKADPAFRFYTLYDKICRPDILEHAYALARANAGAPGVDGVTFAAIEASGLEEWLARLREELECPTGQDKGRRTAGTRQQSTMAASPQSAQQSSERLVGILQLWHTCDGLPLGRRPRP